MSLVLYYKLIDDINNKMYIIIEGNVKITKNNMDNNDQ